MTPEERKAAFDNDEIDFVNRVRRINDFCLEYGCFFELTWLTGMEADSLEGYVSDDARKTEDPATIYEVINQWFTSFEYQPFHRAHFIYRAQNTPMFREFSHHLERGLLLYYKGDFFSAVQVLVPAVEGILRLYVDGGPRQISKALVKQIELAVRPLKYEHFSLRHAAFREILVRFLNKWFFADTEDALLATIPSKMNRHFVAHLLGTEAFYRPADCNRLFAFFDVMLEIVTIEQQEVERFLSHPQEGIDEVTKRQVYYSTLMLPWSPWRAVRELEENFMMHNPNYETSAVPDWAGLGATLQIQEEEAFKDILQGRKPEVKTTPPHPLQPQYSEEARKEGDPKTDV
jgi:hypothetical protein